MNRQAWIFVGVIVGLAAAGCVGVLLTLLVTGALVDNDESEPVGAAESTAVSTGLPPARLTEMAENETRPTRTPRSRSSAPANVTTVKRVLYRITTSRSQHDISLTYENASGNTEQLDTRTLNYTWEKSYTMEPGSFVYISAQSGETSGTVECEILVNGRRLEQASSTGQYVIATCSGRVPD